MVICTLFPKPPKAFGGTELSISHCNRQCHNTTPSRSHAPLHWLRRLAMSHHTHAWQPQSGSMSLHVVLCRTPCHSTPRPESAVATECDRTALAHAAKLCSARLCSPRPPPLFRTKLPRLKTHERAIASSTSSLGSSATLSDWLVTCTSSLPRRFRASLAVARPSTSRECADRTA